MDPFKTFAAAIAAHFTNMSKAGELYRADVDGDFLWRLYLASFPPGTDPLYVTNTVHNGNYDKAFIRRLGNVVRITAAGNLLSIWDVPDLPYPYDVVAGTLAQHVHKQKIDTLFRINESKLGYESTVKQLDDKATHRFYHFHAEIEANHRTADVAEALGRANATVHVMGRGFDELTFDALDTVLDLIKQNTLYRGAEFQAGVQSFRNAKHAYGKASSDQEKSVVLWNNLRSPGMRIRNTAIGTLLIDLSEGMDLETAVRKYERVVAPTNYKRPTALITPAMIKQATETIHELGLESALERRHAKMSDININNVLWANRSAAKKMKGGALAELLAETKKATRPNKAASDEIPIENFVDRVVPDASEIELWFGNSLCSNLMSLTAPVDQDAASLFKWGNNFAWSYVGDITDSIKEKVKAAGGNTDAVLRVSLAWSNYDDLDLHSRSPDGHVYFAQKGGDKYGPYGHGPNGQILDVDMNAGGGKTREPVENQSWRRPADGRYMISVNQYSQRETNDVGFTVEVENDGKVSQYSYPHAVRGTVEVLDFTVKDQKITDLKICDSKIVGQGIERAMWGINTENFVPVSTIMHSPNHWDGEQTGNKHWFFIMKDCKNPEPTRGIYNEFLKPQLEAHRKVFEILGSKTKCEVADEQLSGLGFSSTKRDSVIARVTAGTKTKLYTIKF